MNFEKSYIGRLYCWDRIVSSTLSPPHRFPFQAPAASHWLTTGITAVSEHGSGTQGVGNNGRV